MLSAIRSQRPHPWRVAIEGTLPAPHLLPRPSGRASDTQSKTLEDECLLFLASAFECGVVWSFQNTRRNDCSNCDTPRMSQQNGRIRGSSNAKAKRLLDWKPTYTSWRD